jgi:hypothetical protein
VAAHRNVAQTPAELVDQSVMERADEDEVVEIAPAAISPPHDVVSLGEPRRTAAREPTLTVAVTDLPEKRRGRRALRSTGVEDAAGRIFDHGLDASVAEIAPNDLGMEHGPGLELGAVRAGGQTVGLGVDHDRRTIGVARVAAPAEQSATRASARLEAMSRSCSSPGMAGIVAAIRSIALTTRAPSATGSSASKPMRRSSSRNQ